MEGQVDNKHMALKKALLSGFERYKSKYCFQNKSLVNWPKVAKYQYILEFREYWNQLSVEDELVVLDGKIFIPEELPNEH